MDSSLQVFNNEDFGEIRVLAIDSEPWFVARDVTDALGLDRTATRRLDDDEKDVRSMHTPGGEQEVTIVTESRRASTGACRTTCACPRR